jgi:mono/diheme cytochrome c family protein
MLEESAMRSKENHTPFIAIAFGLTLCILIIFQIYIWREPARIEANEAEDHAAAVEAGQDLYGENCASCHGDNGEGGVGPALNSQELLKLTQDEALFSLTRTGVPGTIMPAWGQTFGGPFTDQQITQMVAFIRHWEPTAPEPEPVTNEPDPARGALIYSQTCAICHGENGQGTETIPALNDPERLNKLNDAWYRNTIAHGRPAKGMPTWGTVLSPSQINDLVALLAAWREGDTVPVNIPLTRYLSNALFAIRQFDRPDAEYFLNAALTQADSAQVEVIEEVIGLVEENRLFEAETGLITLLPPEEMGQALYDSNCAPCHGANGNGDLGPGLRPSSFIQAKSDEELIAFMLAGRAGTAMDGLEGVLTEEELANVLFLMRAWQE